MISHNQNKKTHVISLTLLLDDWTPRIWRRIWVLDTIHLDKLCGILYSSMNWSGYHLSEIETKTRSYGDITIGEQAERMLDWRKYTLKDILKEGTRFKYYYDFGDSWKMSVVAKVEKDLALDAIYPVCVNGKNAAPPEDVGSYGGYEDFINAMNNKKHPRHKEFKRWYWSDTFDPKHFSVDETNNEIDDFLTRPQTKFEL